MARILLGVSGGIAAYKALEFARLATRADHGVRVLMTPTAHRFVGAASFEGIVGAPVLTAEFDADPSRGAFPGRTGGPGRQTGGPGEAGPSFAAAPAGRRLRSDESDERPAHDPISHLELAANADVFLVAPASANTIAKLAAGICDSHLTTSFLACTAPRILAPAMNARMWEDAATQANVATLRERGVIVIEPGSGELASRGERGVGRLPDPAKLLAEVEARLPDSPGPWDGLRVLVTAGGTREPIDPVRFIGNRSSGRMGVALAEAAMRRGAAVTLIAANVTLETSARIERVDLETAAELAEVCRERFPTTHVLLMAAAVADFRPEAAEPGKLSREGSMRLELEATDDVLASLAADRSQDQTLVGFAAEHGGDFLARARGKLERKGLDAIVVNDVSDDSIGFDSAENEVTVIEPAGGHALAKMSKDLTAEAILDRVGAIRAQPVETTKRTPTS